MGVILDNADYGSKYVTGIPTTHVTSPLINVGATDLPIARGSSYRGFYGDSLITQVLYMTLIGAGVEAGIGLFRKLLK